MKKYGPWTIKDSKIVYETPWIKLREDDVIQPDGSDGTWVQVIKSPGISVLALDDEGNAYLGYEFRYALGEYGLETVNGAIDEGETPLQAARRELKEEIGIIADEWTALGVVNPFTAGVHSPAYIFLARKLHFGEAKLDANEDIRIRKVPFTEVVEMVMKSEITHGPGSVLILKTKLFLDREGV